MNFLYPTFLFALSAIAIPVIVHLFNFRRFKRIYFTNVRLLKEIKEETSSREKLKHLLILAARILAITFLVFAFAQPYIPEKNIQVNAARNVVSIYIDNSFSMEALTDEGTLLDEARRRAKEVASAYNPNDRFQLLTNDFLGQHQRLVTKDEFLNMADEVRISPAFRMMDEVLSRQKEAFYNAKNSNKTAYLLSDFQKNTLDAAKLDVDSSVAVRFVYLKANKSSNVSIDSVWFPSPIHKAGQAEQLIVRLRNSSSDKAENIPLKLYINNEQKALGSVNIEANSTSIDTLAFTVNSAGWQDAELSIADYPISFDDQFFFSYEIAEKISILCINGQEENIFINALYNSDTYFILQNVNESRVDYSSLKEKKLIILNQIKQISSGLAQELKRFIATGGSLVVLPPSDPDQNLYQNFLQQIGCDYYGEMNTTENKVEYINLQQDIFKDVFEKIPRNLDLPKVKEYFSLTSSTRTTKEILLGLQGGGALFSRYTYKTGKVYLSAVPFDTEMTNLPKHAIFVPLMYKIALLSGHNYPLAYTISKDNILITEPVKQEQKSVFKLIKKDFEIIPEVRNTDAQTYLYLSDQVKDAGLYKFAEGTTQLASFAFNYNRKESKLDYYKADELEKTLVNKNITVVEAGKKSLQKAVAEASFGVRLWKWCILLVLLSLAAEILLLKFLN